MRGHKRACASHNCDWQFLNAADAGWFPAQLRFQVITQSILHTLVFFKMVWTGFIPRVLELSHYTTPNAKFERISIKKRENWELGYDCTRFLVLRLPYWNQYSHSKWPDVLYYVHSTWFFWGLDYCKPWGIFYLRALVSCYDARPCAPDEVWLHPVYHSACYHDVVCSWFSDSDKRENWSAWLRLKLQCEQALLANMCVSRRLHKAVASRIKRRDITMTLYGCRLCFCITSLRRMSLADVNYYVFLR